MRFIVKVYEAVKPEVSVLHKRREDADEELEGLQEQNPENRYEIIPVED